MAEETQPAAQWLIPEHHNVPYFLKIPLSTEELHVVHPRFCGKYGGASEARVELDFRKQKPRDEKSSYLYSPSPLLRYVLPFFC